MKRLRAIPDTHIKYSAPVIDPSVSCILNMHLSSARTVSQYQAQNIPWLPYQFGRPGICTGLVEDEAENDTIPDRNG